MFVSTSSLAVLVIFPAVCQLVLKRRKTNPTRTPVISVVSHTGNNRNDNSNLVSQSVPFIAKSNLKNNNVNLNNSNNIANGNKNVLGCDLLKTQSDYDVEKAKLNTDEESGGEGPSTCSLSWIDLYLKWLDWKWSTVCDLQCSKHF